MIVFASLGFGLFIYSSDRASKLNRSWFVFSVFIALWGLSLYGVTSSSSADVALRWQYLLDVSAIFIPVLFFIFVCELLNKKSLFSKRLIFFVGVILAIFSFTPYFKHGVVTKYGFYWINPGEYYIVFPAFFLYVAVFSVYVLIREYRLSDNFIFRAQIRNTLIAAIIGFAGGLTNFFPQVINIYPFGNYFFLLYVVFMSYGVLKYKLLSTRIISAQLFSGAIVLVFLFNLLQPDILLDWIVKFVLFVLVSLFSIFLVRGVYREIEQKEKIEKLAGELKEANQGQASLMHFMNHQIKGRLGSTKDIFAELMTGDYGVMPAEAMPMLAKGLDEANIGVNYVQGILKGASAENGTLPYEMKEMDLQTLVEDVVNKQKEHAENRGLKYSFVLSDGDYKITGDSLQLGEAIRNLIDNSINYTLKGSISISLSSQENKIIFKIVDTGVGLSDEDKLKLFKSGGRGTESLKINVNATGFGLVFVKGVVEAHKGKVWAESEGCGKGSSFIVELPKK